MSFALGIEVELFFLFNCHGFKPVAIEKKKSGNGKPDPCGNAQTRFIPDRNRLEVNCNIVFLLA